MLQLSQSFLGRQVMSLRTGQPVAQTISPIINPDNLKIEGLYCHDSMERNKRLVLLVQDIRDVIPQGFVVNDHDVLADPADLIRLKNIIEMGFEIDGKLVTTPEGRKLGKVDDYAVEVSSMFIQKLYVGQSVVKVFGAGTLSVDRSQIVEITSKRIVIQDPLRPTPVMAGAAVPAS